MAKNPYLIPGTDILKNRLDITNKEELNLRERLASAGRIEQLQRQPFPTPLDYEALKKIHHIIFQDLYDWAGKPRTIGITKPEPLLSGNSVEYPIPIPIIHNQR
ncbi:hypothetical protein MNBD_GAMMA12-2198 [hydrothermal vent metagenome]|uniref:Cell filamentation protein Fic n=1 Tax=hydrothermal vent metagenome TaxID=652676 RepID=A0A3B0YRI6_9ZZZZ